MKERLEEKLRETARQYEYYREQYYGILDGSIKEEGNLTAKFFQEALMITNAELTPLVYVYFGENGRIQDALDLLQA